MSAPAIYIAEPPAAHRARSPVVIDCSVLAPPLFDEPQRDVAAQLIGNRVLHAPWLLDHEIKAALRHLGPLE